MLLRGRDEVGESGVLASCKDRPARRGSTRAAVGLAAALALVAACGQQRTDVGTGSSAQSASAQATSPLPPVDVEPGVVHVHGLGVDPADGGLYAATHSGLFLLPEQGPAVRVANRAQDTMGFAVVGPNNFIGSGHPDPREDDVRPPLLGLIASDDSGQTWQRLSLHGQADFHTLVAAHGVIYGYDSRSGTFMVTADRASWERRSQLPLRDFAVDPADPDLVLATTEQGTARSADGGRTWELVLGAPALVVLAWTSQAGLFGVAADGSVHGSRNRGASWTVLGQAGGEPEAMTVDAGSGSAQLYVALNGGRIVTSRDAGRTFAEGYAEQ